MSLCPDCPSTSTPAPCLPPTPPGGANCCLRLRYTCQIMGGVSTWVLDAVNTECVDNAGCSPYQETCSDSEFTLEQQNGCVCFALPDPLPTPCCDPTCGDTTTTTTSTTTTSTTTTTTTTTTTPPPCAHYEVGGAGTNNGSSTKALPADSCAGTFHFVASTTGNGTPNGQGVIVSVTADGVELGPSGCLTNGSFDVGIPIGTTSLVVTVLAGCNGGPDDTVWSFSAIG